MTEPLRPITDGIEVVCNDCGWCGKISDLRKAAYVNDEPLPPIDELSPIANYCPVCHCQDLTLMGDQ